MFGIVANIWMFWK